MMGFHSFQNIGVFPSVRLSFKTSDQFICCARAEVLIAPPSARPHHFKHGSKFFYISSRCPVVCDLFVEYVYKNTLLRYD